MFKRLLVLLISFIPQDSPDGVGVVFERHLNHGEAVAEIEERQAASNGMRTVEARVTHAKINVELANEPFVA